MKQGKGNSGNLQPIPALEAGAEELTTNEYKAQVFIDMVFPRMAEPCENIPAQSHVKYRGSPSRGWRSRGLSTPVVACTACRNQSPEPQTASFGAPRQPMQVAPRGDKSVNREHRSPPRSGPRGQESKIDAARVSPPPMATIA